LKDLAIASTRTCETTLYERLQVQSTKVQESIGQRYSILKALFGLLDHLFFLLDRAVLNLVDFGWRFALGWVHAEHFQNKVLDKEPRHEKRENIAEEKLTESE
jgi:hypothetical protein